jgi:hypothetical protein
MKDTKLVIERNDKKIHVEVEYDDFVDAMSTLQFLVTYLSKKEKISAVQIITALAMAEIKVGDDLGRLVDALTDQRKN